MTALVREPLVHFVVLGALIFGAHAWFADDLAPETPPIIVSKAMVETLARDFQRQNGRAPEPAERQALIEGHVSDEVLLREAIAMGLDRGDPIVRRRLIQKMEMLLSEMEPLAEPTDAELQAFLDQNAHDYAGVERLGLTHVFLSRDTHGEAPDIGHLLAALKAGADPATLGDPFPRGRVLTSRSRARLERVFGADFAKAVMPQALGAWVGPIRSSYGTHIVRVDKRKPAPAPTLERVRRAVRRAVLDTRKRQARVRALVRLRARYPVQVAP